MVRINLASLTGCVVNIALGAMMAPAAFATELREPLVFASENGLLDILMIARPGPVSGFTIAGPAPTGWYYAVCRRPAQGNACPEGAATSFSYGGFRLALQPGDELKIRLINNLPPLDPTLLERFHDDPLLALNPTDLHTHGLIVPATANAKAPPAVPQYGDFVFAALFNYNGGNTALNPANYNPSAFGALHAHIDVVYNPQSAVDYDIRIPAKHPSGSFWIHPHVHGITLNQLSMGLSGIITVGNVADYLCRDVKCNQPVAESSVRHIILKDLQVLPGGIVQNQEDPAFCQNSNLPAGDGACAGSASSSPSYVGGSWIFSLNGQQYPDITLSQPQGEVWRFTNASGSATYDLVLHNNVTKKRNAFQILSVEGVAAFYPENASAGQIGETLRDRFVVVDCGPLETTYALKPICASQIIMMPGSRVEVFVAYRDANGHLAHAPRGATATLRTNGILTGPGGDPWPEANLAKVAFAPGGGSQPLEPLHVNIAALQTILAPGGLFDSPNPNAKPQPLSAGCAPLPAGFHRRIFFANPNVRDEADGPGTDAYGNAIFGLGYEIVDPQGQPVPGTFHDVKEFDPADMICVPLASGQRPAIETWELVNLATELHNFHIHQTKFSHVAAETARMGRATLASMNSGILEDSVPLPFAIGGPGSQPVVNPESTSCLVSDWRTGKCKATSVWVQIPFTQLGTFVFHCHILEHEDGGMMHAIRVAPSPN